MGHHERKAAEFLAAGGWVIDRPASTETPHLGRVRCACGVDETFALSEGTPKHVCQLPLDHHNPESPRVAPATLAAVVRKQ